MTQRAVMTVRKDGSRSLVVWESGAALARADLSGTLSVPLVAAVLKSLGFEPTTTWRRRNGRSMISTAIVEPIDKA